MQIQPKNFLSPFIEPLRQQISENKIVALFFLTIGCIGVYLAYTWNKTKKVQAMPIINPSPPTPKKPLLDLIAKYNEHREGIQSLQKESKDLINKFEVNDIDLKREILKFIEKEGKKALEELASVKGDEAGMKETFKKFRKMIKEFNKSLCPAIFQDKTRARQNFIDLQWGKNILELLTKAQKNCTRELLEDFEKAVKEKPINEPNRYFSLGSGGSILHHIATLKNLPKEFVQILYRYGINLNAIDEYGSTPLRLAIKNYNYDTAKELISFAKDEDPFLTRFDNFVGGNTPLHLVVGLGDKKSVQNTSETTSLSLAQDLIQKMKKAPNIVDSGGNTPLHLAMLRRDINMIKLLVLCEGNLQAKNKDKKTPVDLLKTSFDDALRTIKRCISQNATIDKTEFETNLPLINEFLDKEHNTLT